MSAIDSAAGKSDTLFGRRIDRLLLEECSEICFAFSLDELPYGTINKPAPVPLCRHLVEDRYGLVRQNDVDALAHDGYQHRRLILFILHTMRVYFIHLSKPTGTVKHAGLDRRRGF